MRGVSRDDTPTTQKRIFMPLTQNNEYVGTYVNFQQNFSLNTSCGMLKTFDYKS